MSTRGAPKRKNITGRLSRDAVLAAAVDLADLGGVGPLTIRRLAEHLGVKPMSIYHHVANKDEILDGMVDAVFAEIVLPPSTDPWRPAIRTRCVSARDALIRHPWAVGMLDSRTNPGPATLAHHEAVLACFRTNGFSVAMTAHAAAVIDSYTYGFALQQVSLPAGGSGGDFEAIVETVEASLADDAFPYMTELATVHVLGSGHYDFGDEFDWGLDLVLDGLERALDSDNRSQEGTP